MNKKEKIIAICFTLAFILLITSCVFICYKLKPVGNEFLIEKVIKKLF